MPNIDGACVISEIDRSVDERSDNRKADNVLLLCIVIIEENKRNISPD